ncbi:hypothetical protein SISNIDRAFT_486999 [Sistotremastrum niveocremeum HHB9708]|uniref:Uncharacterized protein n=1 Tax=Sistotremastrum niveocremeum HHB9708 TaxID=1314777 RepID=A0A164T4C8_9AGAM|nr:hypothetical protein SISNIDRAFT_486999 [Sistotremastrum niveocremeum HHB9708]
MPRRKNGRKQLREAGGQFKSTDAQRSPEGPHALSTNGFLTEEPSSDEDQIEWFGPESADEQADETWSESEDHSSSESHTSSDGSDSSGFLYGSGIDSDIEEVLTRHERRAQRKKIWLANRSTKAAEYQLDGPIHQKGGAKDKTGVSRGPYNIGGSSARSVQRKKLKLRHSMAEIGTTTPKQIEKAVAALDCLRSIPSSSHIQSKITQFVTKRKRSMSPDLDIEEIEAPPLPQFTRSMESDETFNIISSDEEVLKVPEPETVSEEAEADSVVAWVDIEADISVAPSANDTQSIRSLEKLAESALKLARKKKRYRD